MSRIAVRKLSSVATAGRAASPRERIISNLQRLAEMQGRTEQLKADLASLGIKAAEKQPAAAAYVRDPAMWQNKGFWSKVEQEATRHDFWPFVVSGVIVYLALGVWLPLSLPDSGKKTSDYWKLLTNESSEGHH